MLTKMSYEEVPGYLRRCNPNKNFAVKTVREFAELNIDAAEVTGFPVNQCAASKAAHLKAAIKEASMSRVVSVSCSGDRVFLVRAR